MKSGRRNSRAQPLRAAAWYQESLFRRTRNFADADDRGRVVEHRREDREGQHLLVADQHGGALMIDLDNAGTIEAKGNADIR